MSPLKKRTQIIDKNDKVDKEDDKNIKINKIYYA